MRTTQLYDRRSEQVTLDEVERILFEVRQWTPPPVRALSALRCNDGTAAPAVHIIALPILVPKLEAQ